MVEFGEKIKHLREEKGMTQQTMADKLFVTRQLMNYCLVRNYESTSIQRPFWRKRRRISLRQ